MTNANGTTITWTIWPDDISGDITDEQAGRGASVPDGDRRIWLEVQWDAEHGCWDWSAEEMATPDEGGIYLAGGDAPTREQACDEAEAWLSVQPAREAYDAATRPAREACDAAKRAARKACDAAKRAAREAYDAAERPAWEAYDAAKRPAEEAYVAAVRAAREAYDAAERPAWEAYVAAERAAEEAYVAAAQAAGGTAK